MNPRCVAWKGPASRVAAFGDKDRDFVRVILVEALIDADVRAAAAELD